MSDPVPIPTSPVRKDVNNLRRSSHSPPPQYTPCLEPRTQHQTQTTIPHLNFSLSSSPLPSPSHSPDLSHHLTSPFSPPTPYIYPSSPYLQSPSHAYSPLLAGSNHTSILPSTLFSPLYSPEPTTNSTPWQKRERARRRQLIGIIASVFILLVALAVGLSVLGVVFRWGKGAYCIRWDDGGSSGDCQAGGRS